MNGFRTPIPLDPRMGKRFYLTIYMYIVWYNVLSSIILYSSFFLRCTYCIFMLIYDFLLPNQLTHKMYLWFLNWTCKYCLTSCTISWVEWINWIELIWLTMCLSISHIALILPEAKIDIYTCHLYVFWHDPLFWVTPLYMLCECHKLLNYCLVISFFILFCQFWVLSFFKLKIIGS